MISPADIESKRFTTVRIKEGYDEDEVDTFLDQVGIQMRDANEQVKALNNELARTKAQLATVQRQLDTYGSQPTQVMEKTETVPQWVGDMTRILGVAQQTADLQIAEAKSEASRIVGAASDEAEKQRTAAQSDVYNMQARLRQVREQERGLRSFITEQLDVLKGNLESNDPG